MRFQPCGECNAKLAGDDETLVMIDLGEYAFICRACAEKRTAKKMHDGLLARLHLEGFVTELLG